MKHILHFLTGAAFSAGCILVWFAAMWFSVHFIFGQEFAGLSMFLSTLVVAGGLFSAVAKAN